MVVVSGVRRGSAAYRAGIRAGDIICSIADERCMDFIDYEYLTAQENFDIEFKKPDGKTRVKRIKKAEYEELGAELTETKCRACANHCLFCFVDQLPKGMRETLYFKDDDWRMSFLMGNYVTLTNVGEREFERILKRKTSPLYISVHATDAQVRKRILNNEKADILPRLAALKENGIYFDCQAVLAAGINDGEVLRRTIADLMELHPYARSLALVPVGLTRHRKDLYPLSPLTQAQAEEILAIAEEFGKKALVSLNTRFVFPADELYMRAGAALPPADFYEELLQKEDGVGMTSAFLQEAETALFEADECSPFKHVSIACGSDIATYFEKLAVKCESRLGVSISVYAVRNDFFGETVTVSGLLTGRDIAAQLKDKPLGERLFFSACALKRFEDVFLDGVTPDELCDILSVEVKAVEADGYSFINALLDREDNND